MTPGSHRTDVVFVSLIKQESQRPAVRLLVESVRSFGGQLGGCPLLLFEAKPGAADPWRGGEAEVKIIPLIVPDALEGYPLAAKVYACARGEDRVRETGRVRSLVWIDPGCLVLNPPVLFDLGEAGPGRGARGEPEGAHFDAALRPVHIRNVGLPAGAPLDGYWQKIYEAAGVREIGEAVEAFVDGERLRAYFNTHAFAVNPERGLLREWYEVFRTLVGDDDFQSGPCREGRHKVFLHQAVLSALLAAALPWDRICILPPEYNYPYNLHASVTSERRARALNDLVTVVYEDRSLDPARVTDIEIRDPLRAWLAARVESAENL